MSGHANVVKSEIHRQTRKSFVQFDGVHFFFLSKKAKKKKKKKEKKKRRKKEEEKKIITDKNA